MNPTEYGKIKTSESHYKEKLLRLISEIEEKREEKKLVK
jgi:hypothetical protein